MVYLCLEQCGNVFGRSLHETLPPPAVMLHFYKFSVQQESSDCTVGVCEGELERMWVIEESQKACSEGRVNI